jgi:hypothetical protein
MKGRVPAYMAMIFIIAVVPSITFAQASQPSGAVTRAEKKQDVRSAESNGYDPSKTGFADPNYTACTARSAGQNGVKCGPARRTRKKAVDK